jgi:hypothetical protein
MVVEGPHDVELVGRLLKPSGLHRVPRFSVLDPRFHPLVPRQFPPDDDLLKRVPVPTFFAGSGHTIAVHSAVGDGQIGRTVRAADAALDQGLLALDSVGIFIDADQTPPHERFARLRAALPSFSFPDRAGTVSAGSPRFGVYVFPDNQTLGTLEDLLLDAAGNIYPTTLRAAQAFVGDVDPAHDEFRDDDLRDLLKPAGRNKATVACVASVLRPGKALQVSIQDNQWLSERALALPRLQKARAFLIDLLALAVE